jgi:hypothetical protein
LNRHATQIAVAAPEQLPKAAQTSAFQAATADRFPLVELTQAFAVAKLFRCFPASKLGSGLKGLADLSLVLSDNR